MRSRAATMLYAFAVCAAIVALCTLRAPAWAQVRSGSAAAPAVSSGTRVPEPGAPPAAAPARPALPASSSASPPASAPRSALPVSSSASPPASAPQPAPADPAPSAASQVPAAGGWNGGADAAAAAAPAADADSARHAPSDAGQPDAPLCAPAVASADELTSPPRASVAPVPPSVPAPSAVPAPPAAQPVPLFWPTLPFAPEPDANHDDVWQLAERIFPVLPAGQREGWLGYLTLAIMALVASMLAGRARQRLPVRGLIPRGVGTLQLGLRALVILLALTAIARLLPRPFRPAIPWVVLAAAAAVGWSARDFLPDAFAAAFMVVERRIRPGRWVTGSGFEGEVEAIGVRATRLRDAEGRTVLVPNRTLLAAPVTTESSRRPIMEVAIRAPAGLDPLVVRRAIEDAALLSPWRALDHQPDVRRDGENATLWRVRVRLLEARFLKSFQSALVDHVEQMLAPSKAGCGPDARAT